jgi:hypothetical protein
VPPDTRQTATLPAPLAIDRTERENHGMMENEPKSGVLERLDQLHKYFLIIPVWVLTTVVYLVGAYWAGAGRKLPELPPEAAPAAGWGSGKNRPGRRENKLINWVAGPKKTTLNQRERISCDGP